MDLGLKDQVLMVAASSKGLGFGIARRAALEGAALSLGSRNKNNISEAADRIKQEVPDARVYASVLDVADPGSIESWVRNTLKELGTIDGLVINGGGPPPGKFDEIDDSVWLAGYENTLMSAVRLIREVLPEMRRKQSGSILTVTSSSVKEPIDNLLLSNVFRSGVTSLVKSLSFQVAKDNIRINNLVPGFFDTERLKELDLHNSGEWRITLENVRKINFDKIPMGRYGDPNEFGKAAAFLLSEAASYVTGETFVIDGGKMRTVW
ncbi:MAG: SDR family oxidoreductase [Bacteroidales bacterium]|nr:SDR family oxidoreductase [Bacteroidales bacterium]